MKRVAKSQVAETNKATEVVKTVSIIGLVQQSGVGLTQHGEVYKGLCPFHRDVDTPSLVVYPGTNSWTCFGSGCGDRVTGRLNGGSVIDWVMQKERMSFQDAVDWLAARSTGRIRSSAVVTSAPVRKPPPAPISAAIIRYWHGLLGEHREYFHQRGFRDEFIDAEQWGWTGHRYAIPVWEGKPGESVCLGARLRRPAGVSGPKYTGVAGHNPATVWGRYHCQGHSLVLAFAGEFDAARSVQDGLPAFSVVNGINALGRFPPAWPTLWFPTTSFLVVVFDKREEPAAGRVAAAWNQVKGTMTARVFHWPPHVDAKDYCEFRDGGGTRDEFWALVMQQLEA